MPPPRVSFPVFERDYYIGILEVDRVFGNFQNAQSLSFDGFGDVYIADADAPGIYKFTRKGDSLRSVIGVGSSHGQFDSPSDIDALLTNSIAVADKNNHRIEIYSRDLIWQASIGGHLLGSKIQFGSPMAVRAASSGYFYLIDGENRRLIGVNPTTGIQQPINTNGSTLGLDLRPQSIAIDAGEYVNVADANFRAIINFNNALSPIKQIRFSPANEARLTTSEDNLIVFDSRSNTIRLFNFRDLSYLGSYSLPKEARNAVMVTLHNDLFYVLCKDRVVVCSIHRT